MVWLIEWDGDSVVLDDEERDAQYDELTDSVLYEEGVENEDSLVWFELESDDSDDTHRTFIINRRPFAWFLFEDATMHKKKGEPCGIRHLFLIVHDSEEELLSSEPYHGFSGDRREFWQSIRPGDRLVGKFATSILLAKRFVGS